MSETKMKKTLRINFNTEFKAVKEEGIVEAYVSVFNNIDSDGDIIIRGAFLESLIKKLPVGCWSHNWDEPVAKTLEAKEDERGLYIKGQFILGVQKAKEAFELIKAGVITEFSIGFRILDWEYNDAGNRVIKKVRLFEWSPVLAGANPDTEVLNIKSEDMAFKFLVKKDGEDEPVGIAHVVAPQDMENIPELAEAGVVEGDTIFLPEDEADLSPALPAEVIIEETPAIVAEGSGEGSGEGDKETETETNQNNIELGKSLKEFSLAINNLVGALSPLAEKIEKSLVGQGTRVKVENEMPAQKVLRLRQATKQIDKNAETILRILKN